MKSTISVATVLSLTLVASACARQPQPQMIRKNKVVAASPEQALEAVIAVFGEQNWAIKTIERRSGLVASDWMVVSRDPAFADCGAELPAQVDHRAARLTVMILDNDGLTTVRVNALYREVRENARDQWYANCVSMGGVEALIHNGVVDHLRRRGIAPPPSPSPTTTQ